MNRSLRARGTPNLGIMARIGIAILLFGMFLIPVEAQSFPPTATQDVLAQKSSKPAYLDPTLPTDQRVNDLVSRLTLDEKVSQMQDVAAAIPRLGRSEEHTSELQSLTNLVCRLLLEKKKK